MTARIIAVTKNLDLVTEYLLYITAFFIPFLISHPQLVVGSVVNAMLFIAADQLPRKHLLPLAVLPSVAAVARGIVFGPYTPFLTYFLPIIWAGNLILMLTFRNLLALPKTLRLMASAALKAIPLYLMAVIYFGLGVVPEMFLSAMGTVQIATALIGGFAALAFMKAMDRAPN